MYKNLGAGILRNSSTTKSKQAGLLELFKRLPGKTTWKSSTKSAKPRKAYFYRYIWSVKPFLEAYIIISLPSISSAAGCKNPRTHSMATSVDCLNISFWLLSLLKVHSRFEHYHILSKKKNPDCVWDMPVKVDIQRFQLRYTIPFVILID